MYFDNCRSTSWNSPSKKLRTCGYQGNHNFRDQIPSKQTLQNVLHCNSTKQQGEALQNSETSKQAHHTKGCRTPKKGYRIARVTFSEHLKISTSHFQLNVVAKNNNSMKYSSSKEANSCSSSRDIPRFIWNHKAQCRVYNGPPMTLSWDNSIPFKTPQSIPWRRILVTFSHFFFRFLWHLGRTRIT
jgi:hypothetical protein